MSEASHHSEKITLLEKLDRIFFKLETSLNMLGGIVIFLIVFLTATNVLGRWVFDTPVTGYIDWVEQSMAFFAFLGLAYCQRQGAHIRMDIVINHLKKKMQWFMEIISLSFMLVISVILIYGSSLHALRAYNLGDSSMDIGLVTWPAKMIVPFALSVLVIRLILQLWAYSRLLFSSNALPVGIPVLESPVTNDSVKIDPKKIDLENSL